ncbi:MAG: hypothetical protein PHR13_12160 [Dysgonamonadaceae bacterium]|nr:hypothetical protein [Dysgonamonadaceae bacterium]MDD3901909.1 hypothetical protein [Dysgonamonadaceae bacterium]MDD4400253.1 hypothetical protein [Dysgonamonadaceae bacterium]
MANKTQNIHSFKKGYGMIPYKDIRKAREDIKNVLGITSRSQWYQRLSGKIIPDVEEKEAIEKVFIKYRVKKSDIWGE